MTFRFTCSFNYTSKITLLSLRSMSATKRTQPIWSAPPGTLASSDLPPLKLFNSLTSNKEAFIPQKGNNVVWYGCGPTVYDKSHMGHARTYISFDIIRRVLADYFKYNVQYIMNITDIDDKIIKRARQNYLFGTYLKKAETKSFNEINTDIESALGRLKKKVSTETDPDKNAMHQRELTKIENALLAPKKDKKELISDCQDTLADWLDNQFGSTVQDNSIFEELPRQFENEYFVDMDALNILRPDVLTRVSEFIPQIIKFVEKIVNNGYAYESKGSVYFNVNKFDSDDGHFYAKLVPTAVGDEAKLNEGEGDLSLGGEKQSARDFAVWKMSKPGEPSWDSPWGKGRPGWHIECSVMASSVCGESMDIHSGGVDLKFPHHDNEIAQSEAHYGNDSWVRYFLHSGHLTISGCKMSKSLKNFITIREALDRYSSRQLRIAFLLHSWKDTLDYSDETMVEAVSYEKLFADFFFRALHFQSKKSDLPADSTADAELEKKIAVTKDAVHAALLDSIDTRSAMLALQTLISDCNAYILQTQTKKSSVNGQLLAEAAAFISQLMKMFGTVTLEEGATLPEGHIGFEPLKLQDPPMLAKVMTKFVADVQRCGEKQIQSLCQQLSQEVSSLFANIDTDNIKPTLEKVADVREQIRAFARKEKLKDVLTLCDVLRDDSLPNLGIRLEDPEGGQATVIGLGDLQMLRQEAAERANKEQLKAERAEKARLEKERLAAEKEAKNRIPPSELFKSETDKYSKFDDKGLPTHDAKGEELSKGLLKKLAKLMEQQEKKRNEWLKSNNAN